jgi:hypothetical protein
MEPVSKLHLDDVKWYHDPTAGDSIPTCCLHSYTLSVLTALNAQEDQVDPVWVAGASGMAFRIWAHQDLCPSATSVFDWSLLPRGVENAGWSVDYHSRLWHEESVAEERRKAAHAAIVKALNAGRVPVCWDIGVPEWGVITGYDDEAQEYAAIAVYGGPAPLKYDQLGRRDLPIMSVTIIEGRNSIDRREAVVNSLKTAVKHAGQGEWLERPAYQDGLPAYETWANALEKLAEGGEQNMLSYYAGTYLAARHYAKRYLRLAAEMLGGAQQLVDAANFYAEVEQRLTEVWKILGQDGQRSADELRKCAELLRAAKASEQKAIEQIKGYLASL